MSLTIEDIRNPNRASGFDHTQVHPSEGRRKRHRAITYGGSRGKQTWQGPWRGTGAEAAQDYCDRINNGATPATPALKSAGHKRTSTPRTWSEGVQKLRQQLRAAIAAEREAEGLQGCLYLIGETYGQVGQPTVYEHEAGWLVSANAVKVGYSETPDVRISGGQTFNPRILVLLGTIPNKTKDDESALHGKYISDNVLHEWFRPTPELLSEFGVKCNLKGFGCMWVEKGEV